MRISRPSAITASIVQLFTGSLSTQITHVPQLEVSHPQCVPRSRSSSRMKWTSSMRGSTSRVYSVPLTVIVTCMVRLPGWLGQSDGAPAV
ncbi:unannotated protein [freshwater metagenome]|uniref:Unannotated protein n=1 Tax=freshwater metagenome TaxID=449393 RepID=A0A6J7RBC9_9ZZZZ